MKFYELDPATWDRGHGARGEVELDGPYGRCCLGFVAIAEGIDLGGEEPRPWRAKSPGDCVRTTFDAWAELGLVQEATFLGVDKGVSETLLCTRLMRVNDDTYPMSDEERVARLNSILSADGADWHFALSSLRVESPR